MSRIFLGVINILFIALFLYTGLEKLLAHNQFSEQLRDSPLLAPISGMLVWTVPLLELATVTALCMENLRLSGLFMAFALMGAFTIYTIILQSEYYNVPCSCGGFFERLPPIAHVVIDSLLTALAGTGLWMTKIIRKKKGVVQSR